MIEMIEMPSDKVVGLRITGKIDKPDMDRVIKAIEAKFALTDKVRIYVELASFGGLTLAALVDDLKFAFAHLKQFEKKAVVSRHDWLGKLVDMGDKLFPSIEVRHFTCEEKPAAMIWVQS